MPEDKFKEGEWSTALQKYKLIELGAVFLGNQLVQESDNEVVRAFLKSKDFDDGMID